MNTEYQKQKEAEEKRLQTLANKARLENIRNALAAQFKTL